MNKKGFSLIETLVAVTIISSMLIAGFEVVSNISMHRVKITQSLDMNTELYSVIENIVGLIQNGGTIDYEEYWGRKSVGQTLAAGHYSEFTGFGNYGSGGTGTNFGDGPYACISGLNVHMGFDGCINTTFNVYGTGTLGKRQRYTQYSYQFSDYNSDLDSDKGDSDGDGNPVGDNDDDPYFGKWPTAFDGTVGHKELYLIQKAPLGKTNPERLFLRLNRVADPDAPASATCNADGTGSGCIGNLQMLRFIGRDWGMAHDVATTSSGLYDGVIDTWQCQDDFSCDGANNIALSSTGWIDIFSDEVDIRSIDFFLSPEKSSKYAWGENNLNLFVHPYVRLKITVWPSWKKRKLLKWDGWVVTVTTLINLNP